MKKKLGDDYDYTLTSDTNNVSHEMLLVVMMMMVVLSRILMLLMILNKMMAC